MIIEYIESLNDISKITIPRWTGFSLELVDIQLHGFSDTSEKAYGAIIYLRVETPSGDVIVSLLSSKTKVAPLKTVTIPRLELQAALILARLITSTRTAQSLSQVKYQCWTDADIVLKWIQEHASKWKTLVSNRVAEIQTLLPEHKWRHVRSELNPADILSRGATVDTLINTPTWWSGPTWLMRSPKEWPENIINISRDLDLEEKSKDYTVHLITPMLDRIVELFERSSKWIKIIRVIATVRRFIDCTRSKIKDHPKSLSVNADDVAFAEIHVIKYLQGLFFAQEIRDLQSNESVSPKSELASLNPRLDNGILRVNERLSQSKLESEAKHPIVLACQRVTTLLIEHVHKRCQHGGMKLTLGTLR